MDWTNCGLDLGTDKKFFSSSYCPGQLWGPSSHLFNGYLVPFPGVQWLGHEVDLTPPSSTKVKNKLSLNLPFLHTFMGVDDFTLSFKCTYYKDGGVTTSMLVTLTYMKLPQLHEKLLRRMYEQTLHYHFDILYKQCK